MLVNVFKGMWFLYRCAHECLLGPRCLFVRQVSMRISMFILKTICMHGLLNQQREGRCVLGLDLSKLIHTGKSIRQQQNTQQQRTNTLHHKVARMPFGQTANFSQAGSPGWKSTIAVAWLCCEWKWSSFQQDDCCALLTRGLPRGQTFEADTRRSLTAVAGAALRWLGPCPHARIHFKCVRSCLCEQIS